MFNTITDPADRKICAINQFLKARNMKVAGIYQQVKDVYGEVTCNSKQMERNGQ